MIDKRTLKRRWYQFSLRTMFVLMTIISIPMAWVGYSQNWIRQRREVMNRLEVFRFAGKIDRPQSPYGLWLLGEAGVSAIVLGSLNPPETVDEVRELFPEAEVRIGGMTGASIF